MFVSPKFDNDDISRDVCLWHSRNPGKYEREPVYAAYMWNRLMTWGELPNEHDTLELWARMGYTCDDFGVWYYGEEKIDPGWEDDPQLPNCYRYDVTLQDVANFPELSNVDYVILWESDQGFVYTESVELESRPIALDKTESRTLLDLFECMYPTIGTWSDNYEQQSGRMFTLITDPDDVQQTLSDIGYEHNDINGLFVAAGEGDYVEVWGYEGEIPYTHKAIYRIL